jgi:hypothetical protein
MYMNCPRGKILAWTDDAKGSSIGISEPSARPHRRAVGQIECRTRIQPHRGDDLEARVDSRTQALVLALAARQRNVFGRLRDDARVVVLAQVAEGAPGDPEQEEVEHRQEPELEGDRDRILHAYSSS